MVSGHASTVRTTSPLTGTYLFSLNTTDSPISRRVVSCSKRCASIACNSLSKKEATTLASESMYTRVGFRRKRGGFSSKACALRSTQWGADDVTLLIFFMVTPSRQPSHRQCEDRFCQALRACYPRSREPNKKAGAPGLLPHGTPASSICECCACRYIVMIAARRLLP
jgi:hypothetical protein